MSQSRAHFRHNEELHILYRSPNTARVNKSKRLRWGGHVVRMEECKCAFNIITITPMGKIHLGRPRCRWENNIRMDLKEIGTNTRKLVTLAQDTNYWRALVVCH